MVVQDMDQWERNTMARAATLKESETFRQRAKVWHSDAIERNSKACQVSSTTWLRRLQDRWLSAIAYT
jgi:hypothetical protein